MAVMTTTTKILVENNSPKSLLDPVSPPNSVPTDISLATKHVQRYRYAGTSQIYLLDTGPCSEPPTFISSCPRVSLHILF